MIIVPVPLLSLLCDVGRRPIRHRRHRCPIHFDGGQIVTFLAAVFWIPLKECFLEDLVGRHDTRRILAQHLFLVSLDSTKVCCVHFPLV